MAQEYENLPFLLLSLILFKLLLILRPQYFYYYLLQVTYMCLVLLHMYHFLIQQLHRAIFDPKARGWIGPQKETHSKWAKARGAVMVWSAILSRIFFTNKVLLKQPMLIFCFTFFVMLKIQACLKCIFLPCICCLNLKPLHFLHLIEIRNYTISITINLCTLSIHVSNLYTVNVYCRKIPNLFDESGRKGSLANLTASKRVQINKPMFRQYSCIFYPTTT